VTAAAIILCVVAQLFLVVGQLFFKHAMNEATVSSRAQRAGRLFLGIVCQAVWFFLWLGLLQKWDLSRLFPFEGLNPLLLVLAAWLILRERLTLTSWVGVGLITGGLVLVAF
jgi:uncharacterized membrane protein